MTRFDTVCRDSRNMAKETNKEKALATLIESPSVAEAAPKCGLSKETLFRYLRDKEFLSDYRAARRALVENSITQIQQKSSKAVETLEKNLSCGNPAVEVRAAQIILDSAIKGVELNDVLERLEVLEDEYQKQVEENGRSKK